ncbi:MAG: ankyrin repeat domain-containing protein [Gammaproteobacteria bacterium]
MPFIVSPKFLAWLTDPSRESSVNFASWFKLATHNDLDIVFSSIALHFSVREFRVSIKGLISAGAFSYVLKEKDKEGCTCFQWLASSLPANMFQALIQGLDSARELSAVVNEKDGFGHTVLHWVARLGSVEKFQVLINGLISADVLSAAVNGKDKNGDTVLHWVVRNCLDENFQVLINGLNPAALSAAVKEKDSSGDTVLHVAARCLNSADILCLLEKLRKETLRDEIFNNLLEYIDKNWQLSGPEKEAIKTQFKRMHQVSFIESPEFRAFLNDPSEETIQAISAEMIESADPEELVEALKKQGKNSEHFFHNAARYMLPATFEVLINKVKELLPSLIAALKERDYSNYTVLMLLAYPGSLEKFQVLINGLNSVGALSAAVNEKGYMDNYTQLMHIAYSARVEMFQVLINGLISAGMLIPVRKEKDEFDYTMLHQIAYSASVGNLQALIKGLDLAALSAAVNKKDNDGNTVFHSVARYGSANNFKVLINALNLVDAVSAVVKEKNNHGDTVFHQFAGYQSSADIHDLLSHASLEISKKDLDKINGCLDTNKNLTPDEREGIKKQLLIIAVSATFKLGKKPYLLSLKKDVTDKCTEWNKKGKGFFESRKLPGGIKDLRDALKNLTVNSDEHVLNKCVETVGKILTKKVDSTNVNRDPEVMEFYQEKYAELQLVLFKPPLGAQSNCGPQSNKEPTKDGSVNEENAISYQNSL